MLDKDIFQLELEYGTHIKQEYLLKDSVVEVIFLVEEEDFCASEHVIFKID